MFLISTKGKTPQQILQEANQAYQKYQQAEAKSQLLKQKHKYQKKPKTKSRITDVTETCPEKAFEIGL